MSALPQYLPESLEQGSSQATAPGAVSAPLPMCARWVALFSPATRRMLHTAWTYLRRQSNALGFLQARQRRLRVLESVSLGEKRLVSIVEVDGQTFLLGSSGTGLSLLATLSPVSSAAPFERMLQDSLTKSGPR